MGIQRGREVDKLYGTWSMREGKTLREWRDSTAARTQIEIKDRTSWG